MDSVKLSIDKRNIELEDAKQGILNKLNNAIDELSYLRKQFSINKKKVSYLKKRLNDDNNMLSYYNEINTLNEIEKNLIRKENEIELYKMRMFLLGSLLPNVSHSYLLSWYGILRGSLL